MFLKCFSLRAVALSTVAVAALSLSSPVFAADVVAKVNGQEITETELNRVAGAAMGQLGKNVQLPFEVKKELLDELVLRELAYNQAVAKKLEQTPLVKEAMEAARKQLLTQAYMKDFVDQVKTSDIDLRKKYDQLVAELLKTNPPKDEVHTRHILLKDQKEAEEVLAAVKKGGDFEKLAKEKSIDPSAKQNGGDLGYAAKDSLVKEYSDAAFALKDREFVAKPVQSKFGWHVIQSLGKRKAPIATFDQLKPQIAEQVKMEKLKEHLEGLKKTAKVEILLKNDQVSDDGASKTVPEKETPASKK
ncbi:MAG: peptidylprolyl isomerase [Alphaproteobacteria bacterium]